MAIKTEVIYNESLFDERSVANARQKNMDFTIFLDSLTDVDALIEIRMKKDRYTNRYHEYITIRCESPSALKCIRESYHKTFYPVPIDLNPHLLSEPTDEDLGNR